MNKSGFKRVNCLGEKSLGCDTKLGLTRKGFPELNIQLRDGVTHKPQKHAQLHVFTTNKGFHIGDEATKN